MAHAHCTLENCWTIAPLRKLQMCKAKQVGAIFKNGACALEQYWKIVPHSKLCMRKAMQVGATFKIAPAH